jgi:hypothetical protein
MEYDGLGQFYKWKNRIQGEPLDLCTVQQWDGWTAIDTCKVCERGLFVTTYEVSLEWGDTKNYEYIREMCGDCLHELNTKYVRNKSEKY